MTPDERARLAEAMTKATGQRWRIAGQFGDPAVEGACRDEGEAVVVLRAGDRGYVVTYGLEDRVTLPGTYSGRGWLDQLVADAVVAVAEYDAR